MQWRRRRGAGGSGRLRARGARAADAQGTPDYKGIDVALATEGVHPHLYGKSQVKPFRKMGHVTITGGSREEVLERMMRIREQLAVEGKQAPSA